MTDRIGYPHTINQLFKEVDASRTGVPYVAILGDPSDPSSTELVIDGEAVSKANPLPTEILGQPSVARQLAVTTASASQVLTPTCRRISIAAVGCDMRYVVGTGTPAANAATSHYIGADQRLDIAVPAGATIAAIRASTATQNGVLEISELV